MSSACFIRIDSRTELIDGSIRTCSCALRATTRGVSSASGVRPISISGALCRSTRCEAKLEMLSAAERVERTQARYLQAQDQPRRRTGREATHGLSVFDCAGGQRIPVVERVAHHAAGVLARPSARRMRSDAADSRRRGVSARPRSFGASETCSETITRLRCASSVTATWRSDRRFFAPTKTRALAP